MELVLAELLRAGGGRPSSVLVGAFRSRTPTRAKSGAAADRRAGQSSDGARYDVLPTLPLLLYLRACCALRRSSACPFLGELWARVQHARSSAAGGWGGEERPRRGKTHVRRYKYKYCLGNRCLARLRIALQMCCVLRRIDGLLL